MSYKYLLILLGVALVVLGLVTGFWLSVAVWLGLDFIFLGIAHACGIHKIFGKRSDGTLPMWSWLVFFPLHIYTTVIWHLMRLLSREPAHNTVTDTLVVGRRLLGSEFVDEFDNCVDLTAEFAEPLSIRLSPSYWSFPILDGGAPLPEALRATVESLRPGRTFVHCAQGHGRTGLFALAMLLESGEVKNVDDGLQRLRAARPGIRLNREQDAWIRAFVQIAK